MTGINGLVRWGIQFYFIINNLNHISSWFKIRVKVDSLKYHRINPFISMIRCTPPLRPLRLCASAFFFSVQRISFIPGLVRWGFNLI
jgi:hypothetical protein